MSDRKEKLLTKLIQLVNKYDTILVVSMDLSTKYVQEVKMALRNYAILVTGKNSIIRKSILYSNKPYLQDLLPFIKNKVGLVFANGNVKTIREIINSHKEFTLAKPGQSATQDIVVPTGPTGLAPSFTGLFQSLSIPTRIMKNQIEVTFDTRMVRAGSKIGHTEATALKLLRIKPICKKMNVIVIYCDGCAGCMSLGSYQEVNFMEIFFRGVKNVWAVCIELRYPSLASVVYSMRKALIEVETINKMCE